MKIHARDPMQPDESGVGPTPLHLDPTPPPPPPIGNRLRHGNAGGDPQTAPRCGARTRAGTACAAPAVKGRARCRMHGAHSRGPTTPEGRARVIAANTKHNKRSAGFRQFLVDLRKVRTTSADFVERYVERQYRKRSAATDEEN